MIAPHQMPADGHSRGRSVLDNLSCQCARASNYCKWARIRHTVLRHVLRPAKVFLGFPKVLMRIDDVQRKRGTQCVGVQRLSIIATGAARPTLAAMYDSASMRQFVGIDLGREAAPDETTVCKFRHLLEKQQLGKAIFAEVNAHLKSQGMKLSTGTIVDATIINAPSSTKNKDKQRDPEMHQTKKGNQWYFGMKAHIGVDSRSMLIHSVVASAANVHDSQALPYLLHGKERRVWGDSAFAVSAQ